MRLLGLYHIRAQREYKRHTLQKKKLLNIFIVI